MRFQPSYYSDVAESVAPSASSSTATDAASMGIQLVGKAAEIGLDKWRASSDAKLAAWASKAEKKKKKAAPPPVVAAPPPPPPSPWAMTATTKWALAGLGALAIGATVYVLFFKNKPEEPAPRRNPTPRKLAGRVVIKRPGPIRAARTEIPSASEDTGREAEAEEVSGEEYEGDEYAGETE